MNSPVSIRISASQPRGTAGGLERRLRDNPATAQDNSSQRSFWKCIEYSVLMSPMVIRDTLTGRCCRVGASRYDEGVPGLFYFGFSYFRLLFCQRTFYELILAFTSLFDYKLTLYLPRGPPGFEHAVPWPPYLSHLVSLGDTRMLCPDGAKGELLLQPSA